MIDLLDRALRTLLLTGVHDLLTDESQVRFQPPDEQWRATVANLQVNGGPAPALNLYLAEIRQNRQLRSTARQRSVRNGEVVEQLAPTWMECHYLVTAWSPAASELVEATPDEHALLYRALVTLQDATPINVSRIYPTGSAALTEWPGELRNTDLPTELLPVEGFTKLAEFWGTMGTGHRWKPVLQLVVGLPVVWTKPVERGRQVSTVVLRIDLADRPDTQELWVQIGGQVSDLGGLPVGEAEVAVVAVGEGAAVRVTTSEPTTGRFRLDLPLDAVLRPERYRLRARIAGSPDAETTLDWCAPSHDIVFSD